MPGQSRKLHYKLIKATASEHVGHKGDIWYDPATTSLRFYNGDPGGEVLSANTGAYKDYGQGNTAQDVAIDLTYTNHWIVGLNSNSYHYTLADGVDGQTIVFYASNGLSGTDNSDLWVDTAYYWNDGDGAYRSGPRIVRVFDHQSVNQFRTKTTATWMNGGWHFDADVLDIGGF